MKFTRKANCSDEMAMDVPEVMVVDVDPDLAARIKMLAGEVKRLGIYSMQEFDYHATWYHAKTDDDGNELYDQDEVPVPGEEEPGLDLHFLVISDDDFWWETNVAGSGTMLSCESISISELL